MVFFCLEVGDESRVVEVVASLTTELAFELVDSVGWSGGDILTFKQPTDTGIDSKEVYELGVDHVSRSSMRDVAVVVK